MSGADRNTDSDANEHEYAIADQHAHSDTGAERDEYICANRHQHSTDSDNGSVEHASAHGDTGSADGDNGSVEHAAAHGDAGSADGDTSARMGWVEPNDRRYFMQYGWNSIVYCHKRWCGDDRACRVAALSGWQSHPVGFSPIRC